MNPIGHFLTITKHRELVREYCFRAGLYIQGLTHDLSKYSPTEFLIGAKYYSGDKSPNNAERLKSGVSTSWLHHKGRNKHHFEYWIDYSMDRDDPHVLTGIQMPRRYVAELIFDRVSACRVYQGAAYTDRSPLEYWRKGAGRMWFIHPVTKRQIDCLLRMWAEKGEDYTVKYIRDVFLRGTRRW